MPSYGDLKLDDFLWFWWYCQFCAAITPHQYELQVCSNFQLEKQPLEILTMHVQYCEEPATSSIYDPSISNTLCWFTSCEAPDGDVEFDAFVKIHDEQGVPVVPSAIFVNDGFLVQVCVPRWQYFNGACNITMIVHCIHVLYVRHHLCHDLCHYIFVFTYENYVSRTWISCSRPVLLLNFFEDVATWNAGQLTADTQQPS